MPILIDIRDNKVLGREFKRGYEEGFREGGAAMLRHQIKFCFGAVPDELEEQLANLPFPALKELGVRLLSAKSVEELLQ